MSDLYALPGPFAGQVAELLVSGPDRRGSGYLLTPTLVLTAAHVVAGAAGVRVRFEARTPGEWVADAQDVWCDEGLDVAVVTIPARPGGARFAGFGRLGGSGLPLQYTATGFPWFKVRQDDGTYRDQAQVTGQIAPWSNQKEGTLELAVHPPEAGPPDIHSPWEGMSGAAVFAGGRIIGIVTKHHRRDGLARLAANRVDRWFAAPAVDRLRQLLGPSSIPATAGELPDVAQPQWSRDLGRSLRAWAEAELLENEAQPYRLVDAGVPDLDASYVERWGVENGRDPATVSEVLTRSRHVLVEAPAGLGKSTLTCHLARRSAVALLEGMDGAGLPAGVEYVAVRVPARDLVSGRPLPAAIVESVRRRLGGLATQDLAAEQFGPTTPGGRPWLVMLDGLDEIIDPEQRRRVVAAIVADVRRSGSPYRWLVTTRPVPGRELDDLRHAPGVATFTLDVLDDGQLREMAQKWLSDDGTAQQVEEFLGNTRASLQELVRVPLLTAVALLLFRRSAAAGLPTTRPGLYEALVTYFLNGRGEESERQQWFVNRIGNAGGPADLARWLYSRRSEVLYELAVQTLRDGQPTIGHAVAWIKRSADYVPEFLSDWDAVVASMLTSTGLLNPAPAGALAWLHQTVPEYLVARRRAAALSGQWPPPDLANDPLLHDALAAGVAGEQATLTITCLVEQHEALARRLLEFLLTRSDAYDYLLKFHDASVIVDNDSTRVDPHAVLAGKILGHGVAVADPLPERVIRRLLHRARSIFNSLEYCALVAAQPRKQLAMQVLTDMIGDRELSLVVRAGAVAAIARVFGFEPAEAAMAPLMRERGPDKFARERGTGNAVLGMLPDGRLTVALEVAQLGAPARDMVAHLLDQAAIPADDRLGCLIAAEAAALVGDVERARRFVLLYEPERGDTPDLEFAPLMIKAGLRHQALDLIEEAKAIRPARSSHATVAAALLEAGEPGLAAEVARLSMHHDRPRAADYEVLAGCGHLDEVVAALPALRPGTRATLDVVRWADIAQVLRRAGAVDVVTEAAGPLVDAGLRAPAFAELLIDLGDDRGLDMMRAIAADEEAGPAERYAAASYLLDTADRPRGVAALLRLAEAPEALLDAGRPSIGDEALGTARSLALVGERAAAVALLRWLVEEARTRDGRSRSRDSKAMELLCYLDPAVGLAEVDLRLAEEGLDDRDLVQLLTIKAVALKRLARVRR